MMMSMPYYLHPPPHPLAGLFDDDLRGINVNAEYALILAKKSKLPRAMRELVLRRVKRNNR